MLERRFYPRRRTYLGAQLQFGNSSVFDCLIRDVGEAGARLQGSFGNMPLPDRFRLYVHCHGAEYDARAVWRRGEHMGVALLPPTPGNVVPFDPRRRRRMEPPPL
jgi:hypothetical protein